MSDPTVNRPGGRVFRIDRECYVVYVGSDDHRVRPFLRVGTSPSLPDRIRPYVGTVVLSDRLTGNPLDEAITVGSATRRRPDYTGSPDLVHAYSPLTGIPSVEERPISSRDRARREGAFVQFLTDGDLNLTVNGHRIYGLDERERSDSHRAYLVDRAAAIVKETPAAYRRDIFSRSGFLLGTDRSFFRFSGSNLTAHALRPGALEALTGRLMDPALLTRIAGPADATELLIWLKWWVRRRLVAGDTRRVSLVGGGSGTVESGSRRLAQLVDVARAAGLSVEWAPPLASPAPPGPAISEEPVVAREGGGETFPVSPELTLPEGFRWHDNSPPTIIPGIPYRVHESADSLEEDDLLVDPGTFDLDRADGYGALFTLLHRFNEGGAPSGDADTFEREVSRLLAECPAAVTVELVPAGNEYRPRFMVQRGFTLARSRENARAVARINDIIATGDEESFYRDERRRLMDFLDELLRESRATTKHVSADDTATSPGTGGSTSPDAADDGTARFSQPPSPKRSRPTDSPTGDDTLARSGPAPVTADRPASTSKDAAKSTSLSDGDLRSVVRSAGGGTDATVRSSATGRSGASGRSGRRWGALLAAAAVVAVILVFALFRIPRSQPGAVDPSPIEEAPAAVNTEGGVDPVDGPGTSEGDGGSPSGASDTDRAPASDDIGGAPGDGGSVTDTGDGGSSSGPATVESSTATTPNEPETDRAPSDAEATSSTGDGGVAAGDADEAGGDDPAAPIDSPPVSRQDDTPDGSEGGVIDQSATADTATSGPAVPPDTGDSSSEDGEAGAVVISLTDMIRLVNRIARANGYAPLGDDFPGTRDPDWIFPGNVLELPDGSLYTIRDGDTMWGIADRFVQQSVPQERLALIEVERRILWGEIPSRSAEVRERLEVLAEDGLLESTRRSAEELMGE